MAEELIKPANKVIISKSIKTENKLRKLEEQYKYSAKKDNPYYEIYR